MKVKVIDDVVHLIAETQTEALKFVKMAGENPDVIYKEPREVNQHKKHKFKKPCDICGKEFRVMKIHRAKMHGQDTFTQSDSVPIPRFA